MSIVLDGTSGITAPAVDAVLDGADLTAGSVVEGKLETLVVPIGVSQTWTNVAGSRALGVTYTNSTGRPILVNIVASRSNAAGSLNISVDGISTGNLDIAQGVQGFASAIVPNGSEYSISGSTLTTINAWRELR